MKTRPSLPLPPLAAEAARSAEDLRAKMITIKSCVALLLERDKSIIAEHVSLASVFSGTQLSPSLVWKILPEFGDLKIQEDHSLTIAQLAAKWYEADPICRLLRRR